jgi:hypothetical protein
MYARLAGPVTKVLMVQKHALESGVTRVNGVTAWPGLILKDGDRLE